MGNTNSDIPDFHMVRPYFHTHLVETEPKRKIRASVRLTEEAHRLLLDMADANKESMKHIGSEAIFLLDKMVNQEDKVGELIEQIKFKALRFKQLVVFYMLLIGIGMGLVGYIIGLAVK